MEKQQLIETVIRAQRGDSGALSELFNAYYNDVYYFAVKTVRYPDLAYDITQETFVEVIKGTLQNPAHFLPWIRSITYHQCTRYFKKKKELLMPEEADGSTVFDTLQEERSEFIPDRALDQQDFRNTIMEMIDSLSDEQRTAVLLYYFDELPVKTIAAIQGVSESAVKSRLAYARQAIKASVEAYEKKNNVRLHSVTILPLLLWLYAGYVQPMAGTAAEAMADSISRSTGKNVSFKAGKNTAARTKTGAAKTGAAKAVVKGGFSKWLITLLAVAVVAVTVIVSIFAGNTGKNRSGVGTFETEAVWVRTKSTSLYPDGEKRGETQYSYDKAGNLLEKKWIAADGTGGSKTVYTYDERNNLLEEKRIAADGTGGSKTVYTYDERNNLLEEKRIAEDGTEQGKSVYTYDEKNTLLTELRVNENYETLYFYDKDGNITEERRLKDIRSDVHYIYENDRIIEIIQYGSDGEVYQKLVYTYDGNGNNVRQDWHYTDDQSKMFDAYTVYVLNTFDENGRMIKEVGYDQNGLELYGSEWTYNAQGNILTENEFRNLNTKYGATRRTEFSKYTYQYDKNGNVTEHVYTYSEKTSYGDKVDYYRTTETSVYDENGNLLEWKNERKDLRYHDDKSERKVFAYDSNGNKILSEVYKNDTLDERTVWEYDDNGHMTLLEKYDGETLQERRTWVYDENGNLSECSCYYGDIFSFWYIYDYKYMEVSPGYAARIRAQQEKLKD